MHIVNYFNLILPKRKGRHIPEHDKEQGNEIPAQHSFSTLLWTSWLLQQNMKKK
jgi:hypothetical protein